MGHQWKLAASGIAMALLAACAKAPGPLDIVTLPKGEPLNVRYILAANPDKKICVDYQAATNSCQSIITSTIDGNIMRSRERAALKIPGGNGVQNIEVVTRNVLDGMRACVRASDITITGRDEMSTVLLDITRETVNDYGGSVCATYFRAGDGYVVSSVGANGQPFPPGDTQFQFVRGDVKLRAQ